MDVKDVQQIVACNLPSTDNQKPHSRLWDLELGCVFDLVTTIVAGPVDVIEKKVEVASKLFRAYEPKGLLHRKKPRR